MSDRGTASSASSFSPTTATGPAAARPVVAARTKLRLDPGAIGFFVAIAGGFRAYAALTVAGMFRVKESSAPPMQRLWGIGWASKLRRWWLDRDKSRRAIAALDDDQLSNLSDMGRRIWREARRARSRS